MTHRTDSELHRLLVNQGHVPGFTPAKPRKKRDNAESRMQQAVIKWWALKHKELGVPECLLFAIPNGALRDKAVAATLKREGVRSGVPDLFLAVPRRHFCGHFIEMKTDNGVVSDAQEEFIKEADEQRYWVTVCRSFNEAVREIEAYLTP